MTKVLIKDCGTSTTPLLMFLFMIRFVFKDMMVLINVHKKAIEIITNDELKQKILEDHHNCVMIGHPGIKRLVHRVAQRYYWKNMKIDATKFVNNCEKCQKGKMGRKTIIPLKLTSNAERYLQNWYIDVIGIFTMDKDGNRYILTALDELTKYLYTKPMQNLESDTIAKALVSIFCIGGFPETVISDNYSSLICKSFKDILKLLGVKSLNTTVYNPQSNQVERAHATYKTILRIHTDRNATNWGDLVEVATMAMNAALNTSTGFSPFFLKHLVEANCPKISQIAKKKIYSYDSYVNELIHLFKCVYEVSKQNLTKSKIANKVHYDKKSNPIDRRVGDMIFYPKINMGKNLKLQEKWSGPWEVTKIISNENIAVMIKNKEKVLHKNRVKLYKNTAYYSRKEYKKKT